MTRPSMRFSEICMTVEVKVDSTSIHQEMFTNDPKFVFYYGKGEVIVCCDEDYDKTEFRMNIKKAFDFQTKKEIDIEMIFDE